MMYCCAIVYYQRAVQTVVERSDSDQRVVHSVVVCSLRSWWGRGSVSGRALDFGLIGVSTCGFESHQGPFRSLTFPPVLRDWVIKGFGMSSLVYATGHIKDPVPLVEKSRGLSPGGRFPPCFIHQVDRHSRR